MDEMNVTEGATVFTHVQSAPVNSTIPLNSTISSVHTPLTSMLKATLNSTLSNSTKNLRTVFGRIKWHWLYQFSTWMSKIPFRPNMYVSSVFFVFVFCFCLYFFFTIYNRKKNVQMFTGKSLTNLWHDPSELILHYDEWYLEKEYKKRKILSLQYNSYLYNLLRCLELGLHKEFTWNLCACLYYLTRERWECNFSKLPTITWIMYMYWR